MIEIGRGIINYLKYRVLMPLCLQPREPVGHRLRRNSLHLEYRHMESGQRAEKPRQNCLVCGLRSEPLSCSGVVARHAPSVAIHWNGKNNHFRFSLSLFTFFTLRLFLEKWKSEKSEKRK